MASYFEGKTNYMCNFGCRGWAASNVKNRPTFRQTLQLPSSGWMETAVFAETLAYSQHSTQLIPESRRYALNSSRENLRTRIYYRCFKVLKKYLDWKIMTEVYNLTYCRQSNIAICTGHLALLGQWIQGVCDGLSMWRGWGGQGRKTKCWWGNLTENVHLEDREEDEKIALGLIEGR
jgi:hypothetical protein